MARTTTGKSPSGQHVLVGPDQAVTVGPDQLDRAILDYCRTNAIRFYAYMVLEQGVLTGRYNPQNPLPQGSARAEVYNGLLPQLAALTGRLAELGKGRGATAADVAIGWAMAKGATPIVGVTKPQHVDGLVRAAGVTLMAAEMAELEALADAANVDTRGSWEQQM